MAVAAAEVRARTGAARSWRGKLALTLAPRHGRTILVRRRHRGPFLVQSPFHPEGPVCHLVLLHPPGGVVCGDALALDARVETGGHALLTTPAATKLYRSAGPQSRIDQTLRVADGAVLEWLPQETIAFAGTSSRLDTRVLLCGSARFVGWEVTCLGRPACGERFASGALNQSFELWRDGEPLLLDRAAWVGGAPALDAPWGLDGVCVTGTMLVASVEEDAAAIARAAAGSVEGVRAAVSVVDGVLVGRCLGRSAEHARRAFVRVWEALRPGLLGRAACLPRIWAT